MINSSQLQYIQKILDKKYDEFEIRIKIDKQKIFNYFKNNKYNKHIFSVVLMYGDYRRESFYDEKYNKINHIDMEKKQVGHINVGEFKFTASTENTNIGGAFEISKVKDIKIKDRYIYDWSDGHYDITFIEKIKYNTGINLKEKIHKFLSAEKTAEYDIELEYEFTKVDIKKIEAVIINTYNSFGGEYLARYYLEEIKNILQIKVASLSIKQIGNNPVLLDRKTFNTIDIKNYLVLEKTDGKRGFIKYTKTGYIIITEEKIITEGRPEGDFHIFDCEILDDMIYIFDVMIFDGVKLTIPYINRMALLGKIRLSREFRIKEYYEPTCENIKKLLGHKNIDGLIFNEKNAGYLNMHIYKWKPADLITFDFLVMPMPYKGIKPFISDKNLYILMCGCSNKEFGKLNIKVPLQYKELLAKNDIKLGTYNPVPFSVPLWKDAFLYESDEVYKLCVAEFSLDIKSHKWTFIKIRDDKTLLIKSGIYGNDYFVAEKHFNELQNPLTERELCSGKIGSGYFVKDKGMDYKVMAQFNNFVKYNIMKILTGLKNILDIASGKGQDIFIYNGLNIGKCFLVEPDKEAYVELNNRLRSLDDEKFYKYTKRPDINMDYETFNKSYEEYTSVDTNKYNAIVCNFAIHYILKKPEDYAVFSNYCIERGASVVILTYLDYDIVSKYAPYVNEKFDLKIENNMFKIKHHFATEPYLEHIIDTKLLIKHMSQKYELIMRDSFGSYLKERPISEPDATYCSFYQYVVFRKKQV